MTKIRKTVAAAIGALACAIGAHATTFEVLHSFNGAEGAKPLGVPLPAADGSLYGTTSAGGAGRSGVLFRFEGRKFAVLHSFDAAVDGSSAMGRLLMDGSGRVIGTTYLGGAAGAGTLWTFDPAAGFSVGYSFTGASDGGNPTDGLIAGGDGRWYGTTFYGGAGGGTLYAMDPATFQPTTLHTFPPYNSGDTSLPDHTPVWHDGRLYGTGLMGPSPYAVAPDGSGYTEFPGVGDLYFLDPGLVEDARGNVWGVATAGGANHTGGIYRLDRTGVFTPVFSFPEDAWALDESSPVVDARGRLYGTHPYGGLYSTGQVWRYDPATGEYTVLHEFDRTDGSEPFGGLAIDARGTLYGMTEYGGDHGVGTVYRIRP